MSNPISAEERAARLWCSPEKSSTPLDVEFCKAIASQIKAAEASAREQALEEAINILRETYPDTYDSMEGFNKIQSLKRAPEVEK